MNTIHSLLVWAGAILVAYAVFDRLGGEPGLRHELPTVGAVALWIGLNVAPFLLWNG